MSRIKVKQEIQIHRNPIERFLMFLKKYILENRKIVVGGLITVLVLVVVLIVGFIVYEHHIEKNMVNFEQIMDKYEKAKAGKNKKGVESALVELKKLNVDSNFGFAHEMSFYVIGNILFSQQKYKEAIKYLNDFSSKTSSDLFAVISLQKVGFAYENQGNLNKAIDTFSAINEEYKESVLTDQIFYNLGRLFSLKGDESQSKQYFNRVIASYPRSAYAAKSKKMLMIGKIKNVK